MLKDYLENLHPWLETAGDWAASTPLADLFQQPNQSAFAETGRSYLDLKLVSCKLVVFVFCTTSLGIFSMPPRSISFFLPSNLQKLNFLISCLFHREIFSCCLIIFDFVLWFFSASCAIFQHPFKNRVIRPRCSAAVHTAATKPGRNHIPSLTHFPPLCKSDDVIFPRIILKVQIHLCIQYHL